MDARLFGLADQMAATIASIQPSLVIVQGKRDSAGAGVVWRQQGIILTNNHVLNGSEPKVILPDGRQLAAQIIRRDEEIDLALLRVEARDLQPAHVALQGQPRTGELVYAMGHPWGERNFVTVGIISGQGELETRGGRRVAFLRTDARLAPGNSGGPLLTAGGQVAGINTMILGGDQGLAISAQVAEDFASQALVENKPASTSRSSEGFI